jgi:hypothetical protein
MVIDLPAPVLALIAAGRRALDSPPLRGQSMTSVSADLLTDYALRHGMLAWAPCPLQNDALLSHTTRALRGVQQLLEIVERFERAGIAVIALKGPVFSQWLYGDIASRRFSDLDLLVSVETRDTARRLLEQIGFARRIPAAAGDLVYASIGAWPMVHAGRLDVDLHWKLAGRRFSSAVETTDVLR